MLTAMTFVAIAAASSGGVFESELVFPFDPKHNHGSSVVEAANGDLIACWFHGTGERQADDVMVQGARKRKGFSTWSEPFVMTDTQDLPDCNPVLFIDPRGKLWLFWVTIQNNEWGGALLKYRVASEYSDDGAPKWEWQDVIHARPRNLDTLLPGYLDEAAQELKSVIDARPEYRQEIARIKELTKNKLAARTGWMTRLHPIMLSDHRMMLGLYSDVFESSLAAFTNDWGKTWEFSDPIMGLANIQPSFIRKRDGVIAAMMRDNGPRNHIRYAESKDGGLAWSDVTNMEIPNPGSSLECIPLRGGAWVLVCNDTEDGPPQGHGLPLGRRGQDVDSAARARELREGQGRGRLSVRHSGG